MFLAIFGILAQAAASPATVTKQQFLASPMDAIQGEWETPVESRKGEVYARFRISQSKMTVTYLNPAVDPYMIRSYHPGGGVQVEFQEMRDVQESNDGRVFMRFWTRTYLKSENKMLERTNCSVTYNEAYYAAPKGSIEIACGGLNFVRAEHNKKIVQAMSPGFRSWDY